MHILEVVSGAEINGAVVHCALLYREFVRRGHTVTLLCRPGAKVLGLLSGVQVQAIESDMHRFPLGEVRKVAGIATQTGAEVIHTHMTRAHNFGVILRRFSGIPCIATAHSHIVQPLTFMFNDHVVAVSEATRVFQIRQNFVRPAKIDTIYGFTDVDRQSNVRPAARAAVRAELQVGDSAPLIGIIGDIIPRKGHLYLVQALVEISRQVPDVRLLVVGTAKRKIGEQYEARVRDEARKLGVADRILWVGYRTDVPEVMRAVDVFAMPSLDEMFPVAALEAMAAERPIVATRVGGVPECITDGVTGLLVPPEEKQSLAGAIVRLLKDRELAVRLAGAAHSQVLAEFSVQSQAPRLEKLFERVIEHNWRQRPPAQI